MTRQDAIRLALDRIGPFDNHEAAEQAATSAQAKGKFDIHDQQVYLVGPDHRMIVLSEEDVVGDGPGENEVDDYDGELDADHILERQELEDFEGLEPFERSEGE